jgi:hypothetical protein
MEFGLFFLMQRDERWSEQAVYDSGLEQMLAAEALGYQSVWIAEHHFNDYGLCPAPPVLAAFVAARTTTLRLGMGVSLLPIAANSEDTCFRRPDLASLRCRHSSCRWTSSSGGITSIARPRLPPDEAKRKSSTSTTGGR